MRSLYESIFDIDTDETKQRIDRLATSTDKIRKVLYKHFGEVLKNSETDVYGGAYSYVGSPMVSFRIQDALYHEAEPTDELRKEWIARFEKFVADLPAGAKPKMSTHYARKTNPDPIPTDVDVEFRVYPDDKRPFQRKDKTVNSHLYPYVHLLCSKTSIYLFAHKFFVE